MHIRDCISNRLNHCMCHVPKAWIKASFQRHGSGIINAADMTGLKVSEICPLTISQESFIGRELQQAGDKVELHLCANMAQGR